MKLNWLESLLYGLVSGMADFLPISSQGHQELMIKLFGMDAREPVLDLFVHMSVLAALLFSCRNLFEQIRRDRSKMRRSRRGTYQTGKISLSSQFAKNATLPMIIVFLILSFAFRNGSNLLLTAAFLLINGVILFIPERMMHGNKDARSMTLWDSVLFGIFSGISACSGISRVGAATTYALARGAHRQSALQWALLLSVSALGTYIVLDFITVFAQTGEIAFWSNFLCYLISAAGAFCGGYVGIFLIRFLTVRTGYVGFAFYSWGAALLSFLLYLAVA